MPLKVGDTLELNDHRAVVVGICQRLADVPVAAGDLHDLHRARRRSRRASASCCRSCWSKAKPGVDPQELCERIDDATGLAAYTRDEFKEMTVMYFMKYTGIPINFGIAVVLGFIVGTAIAGQTFYNFTLDNLRHFGALKAMGAGNGMLLRMILLQALLVGVIGYGLGVGAGVAVRVR